MPELIELQEQWLDWLVSIGVEREAISRGWPTSTSTRSSTAFTQVFSGFSGVVGMLGVIISALIMMLIDVSTWGRRIAVAGSTHPRIVAAMREFGDGTRRYWLVCTGFGL